MKKILIASGDQEILREHESHLQLNGYEVIITKEINDALKHISEGVDFIVTDVVLNGEYNKTDSNYYQHHYNGINILELAKTKNIPAVVLSVEKLNEIVAEKINEKATKVISLPLRPSQLENIIEEVLAA